MWSFPAFSKDKELVWLRATRSQHVSGTRITHQAAVRLGFAQSVTEAYRVQLRWSSEPRFLLRAEGVETLECIRSRSERRCARALQPDVIVGWLDWNKVQPFVMSGWAVSGQTPPGSNRARHQVAPKDEPEGRSPDAPQRGTGPDEAAINHHP
jgi:hypothetical protein